jgi:membrane associated rhomboid family serine protease
MSILDEIKSSLKGRNNFNILIYINLAVFVLVQLVKIVLFFTGNENYEFLKWLSVPADTGNLLHYPWTVISYMFTHENFLHILLNLLAFFWFGRLFLQFLSQRQLLGVYILGGITGAIFYILAFNIVPAFIKINDLSIAMGASASVMAVVFTVATLVPNQEVYLMFFGKVKFKYLALGVIAIDVISIPLGNAGGHIAHIGGALLGFVFVILYRKGTDITVWLSRFLYGIKGIFIRDREMKVSYRNKKKQTKRPESDMDYNARKKAEQDVMDKILDKIAQSGYSSLSASEKEKLFKVSNNK